MDIMYVRNVEIEWALPFMRLVTVHRVRQFDVWEALNPKKANKLPPGGTIITDV